MIRASRELLVRWLPVAVLLAVTLGCSTTARHELDSEAQEELATLAPRVERVPPDLAALDRTVALYVEHGRFRDAADTVDGTLERSSFDPPALERIAACYALLANAARATRQSGDDTALAESVVVQIERRARAVRALAGYRAQHDHAPVEVSLGLREGGRELLEDVMLECASHDLDPVGVSGAAFAIDYSGDRLRLEPAGRGDARSLEGRLGEIERLVVTQDPLGRARVSIEPRSWARETASCEACTFTDECALVGDRAGRRGLRRVPLHQVTEAVFRVRLRLVTPNPRGRSGAAPAAEPAPSQAGRWVQLAASLLVPLVVLSFLGLYHLVLPSDDIFSVQVLRKEAPTLRRIVVFVPVLVDEYNQSTTAEQQELEQTYLYRRMLQTGIVRRVD